VAAVVRRIRVRQADRGICISAPRAAACVFLAMRRSIRGRAFGRSGGCVSCRSRADLPGFPLSGSALAADEQLPRAIFPARTVNYPDELGSRTLGVAAGLAMRGEPDHPDGRVSRILNRLPPVISRAQNLPRAGRRPPAVGALQLVGRRRVGMEVLLEGLRNTSAGTAFRQAPS